MLLGNLNNVRSLELGGFSTSLILDEELDKFPIFGRLRTLCLNMAPLKTHSLPELPSDKDYHKAGASAPLIMYMYAAAFYI
ncbi:hypothetical protein EJB05_37874, partial [Eragrostis curvula]